MTREAWKAYYREQRITRREAGKAYIDALYSGTGLIWVSGDGFINHILPAAIFQ